MYIFQFQKKFHHKDFRFVNNFLTNFLIKDSDLIYFYKHQQNFQDKTFGFKIKNAKPLRIPIPWKGQLGFFDVGLSKARIKNKDIVTDIIDEEYRYQWIGHH